MESSQRLEALAEELRRLVPYGPTAGKLAESPILSILADPHRQGTPQFRARAVRARIRAAIDGLQGEYRIGGSSISSDRLRRAYIELIPLEGTPLYRMDRRRRVALEILGLNISVATWRRHVELELMLVLAHALLEGTDHNAALVESLRTVPSPAQPVSTQRQDPVRIFLSYSHRDDRHRERLETHLASLRRQGIISDWSDRRIVPGEAWAGVIDARLEEADIILLLVSADFLASEYCYELEMQRALARHKLGLARVVPIIVRPADWQHSPFADLQALPRDGRPVSDWSNRDRAWLDVVSGIRRLVNSIRSSRQP